ncbi:PQQ-dependent sugar dehydrogenase [Candidatus Gottesmanbacteria bacterium]|nr:PQQ-dependent sugar dehydrogenase [Candidatus Gottesmanbacteria bacterium]
MKNILILFAILIFIGAGGFYFWTSKNKNTPPSPIQQIPSVSREKIDSESPPIAVVAENLEVPWAIAFLPASPAGGPDGGMLVTERPGRVRFIDNDGKLDSTPVATIDSVNAVGEGGLMGIALHPDFEKNQYVYLYYTYDGSGNNTSNRLVRMRFENNHLANEEILVDSIPGASNHNGGRIKFGPDGFLYIGTGDVQEPSQSQNRNTLGGKILRVTDTGKPAPGNPFGNEVYSYGHRNVQGLAWDSRGQMWATEHGPSGIWPNCCQDEINRIEQQGNYGWPQSVGDKVAAGTVGPMFHSGRDIWAPSGASIVGDSFFFAGLRGVTLYEAVIENGEVTEVKEHFKGQFGRLREVVVGPDNMLYITTSNRDGRGKPQSGDDKVIRVNPNLL